MTLTRRPSPFGELMTPRLAMDRLLDDTLYRPFTGHAGSDRSSTEPQKVEQ